MGNSLWTIGTSSLTWPDYVLLACLLVTMIGTGTWMGRKGTTTKDFFLARHRVPWWVACLSFVATEVSALTLIAVPATAFRENWEYAQFFIGSFAARVVIAYWFIPAFYHYNCITIYEFLKYRFGPASQYCATIFFFITRLLGSGLRLMTAALAVAVLLGWHIFPVIILFMAIGVAYITYGGIASVVWTGAMQASIYMIGGLGSIAYLLWHIPGGYATALHVASSTGHLQFWDWGPSFGDPQFLHRFFGDPNIVWIAILNGFFGSLAAFGTDHELMQRLLTLDTRRESQRTMLTTPFASLFVLLIFLTVGTCLFVFYHVHPQLPLPAKIDAIFPHFIGHVMPVLMRGLLLTAIVMTIIDSPLSSLTASFVNDIFKPLIRPNQEDRYYLRISRFCIAVFAMLLAAIAYVFSFFQNFLWLAFKIGGVTFGSMLGVFLLGLFTTRVSNRANVVGMIAMALINAALLGLSESHLISMGWTWLVLIGTAGTFAIGWFFGPALES